MTFEMQDASISPVNFLGSARSLTTSDQIQRIRRTSSPAPGGCTTGRHRGTLSVSTGCIACALRTYSGLRASLRETLGARRDHPVITAGTAAARIRARWWCRCRVGAHFRARLRCSVQARRRTRQFLRAGNVAQRTFERGLCCNRAWRMPLGDVRGLCMPPSSVHFVPALDCTVDRIAYFRACEATRRRIGSEWVRNDAGRGKG